MAEADKRTPWFRDATHNTKSPWVLDASEDLELVNLNPKNDKTQRTWWQRLSVGFFCILSTFALAVVFLSQSIPSAKTHDNGHTERPHQPKPSPPSEGIQYHEDVPSSPKLRDSDEYILPLSWDFDARPTTREYYWTINSATLNPDGVYRPMLVINNQYPGPLVECNEGDTVIVHVMNKAPNATAIHFHGMFQNGTNNMDGTVGVTQCPIAPNSNFTYQFDVNGQHGTYWYHAHNSAQASDGLLGPMVIHSKREKELQKLDYATDRVVMVQDHYHNLTSELLMEYLAPDQENDEPVPDNALINGRGVRDCADFEGWPCDATSVSTPTIDLAAGQRHRLRIINVGAFAEFQIQFDEHPFFITEVDGTDVHPEPFHRLNVMPAQRYSVVLETNVTASQPAFWMRARMVTHCFKRDNQYLQPEIRAILRYTSPDSKPSTDKPTSKEWSDAIEVICRDLNTTVLRPVESISPPLADDFVVLRANFEIGDWRLARGFFNDSTWHGNATHPSLHRYLDAKIKSSTNTPLGINEQVFSREKEMVLESTGIRTIDVSINNFDDGAHPFHLHGHKFFVLLQGNSGYPPNATELPQYLEKHGLLENPLRRDTVTVEGYAWAVIRVVLDNPGMWAFHCHNTWHAESGMLMQMLVRSEVVNTWKVDSEHREMCGREGVATGMRPDDSIWFGQF
ncbi:hypothetical protein NM208_g13896 [Fusarium decemcellulare]|uniref:Uncharacterized protein n=1 Tax=Fusarium decemcellulare TaxID=57161 RepID=A0ACC1RLK9_9HYPO|nr:hypothetical protein NM208_g13896 [Fusarium decemcellulare]